MRKSALYICYYSLLEPLVQTQVIPYLRELSQNGFQIMLLTYEPSARTFPPLRWRFQVIMRRLAKYGIRWHCLTYHVGPLPVAKLLDVILGVLYSGFLVIKYRVTMVHARSHLAAAIGYGLKKLLGVKLIFDVRGLIADEYVDAGIMTPRELTYRVTKWLEKAILSRADAIVVLTQTLKDFLVTTIPALRDGRPLIEVIPCCVDQMAYDSMSSGYPAFVRKKLGLTNKVVLVYVGKLGGWYLSEEMVSFFATAREVFSNLHFLILTQSDYEIIRKEFREHGITEDSYTILTIDPVQIPGYLAACDLGISFDKRSLSKMAASPTKVGEYLAAGLPLVMNAGIGDCDELILKNQTGVLVNAFTQEKYRAASVELAELLRKATIKDRCRAVARQYLSLSKIGSERYLRIYNTLMGPTARGS